MDGQFTIQISADLVNRLVEDGGKSKKKTKKPKSKIEKKPQPSQVKVHQMHPSETHADIPPAGWPTQPPFFVPVPPTPAPVPPTPAQVANEELEAIRSVVRESEKVVERLQKQEDNMLQEVTQRAKELHDKEFKLPYQKPVPCSSERDACLECYKEHNKNPLKCALLVNSFADCARKIRQQMSSAS